MVALAAAFGILFIGKTGIRDKIIMKAPKLISELFSCDFCLSFWAGMLICVILAFTFTNFCIIFIPVLSAPLTRIFL